MILKRLSESCDVLISPVTPTPAWKMGENTEDPLAVYMSDILTISANLAGIPGMSVPGGFTADWFARRCAASGSSFSGRKIVSRPVSILSSGLDLRKGNWIFKIPTRGATCLLGLFT